MRYHASAMASALSDTELLKRLVAFDSTSGISNHPIADCVCEYLDQPNVLILRNEKADEDKVNLVVRVGDPHRFSNQRSGLILSGHMDVVPARGPEWQSNPFTVTERQGRLYGRGACDMKGFLALAMNLARSITEESLVATLVLVFTFDEELGLLGAQHFARTWEHSFCLPTSAIIGEPTGMRVVRMHKGHLIVRVTASGRSAHSAYPHLGRNAIEPAGRVIVALSELRDALKAERAEASDYFPETPYPTLNIGRITGGEAVNIVPDRCVIEVGARVLPGTSSKELITRIRATVEGLDEPGDLAVEEVNDGPSLMTPADAPIHRFLCEEMSQTESCAVSYATDGGVLGQMGIDCVVFGPGSIEVAHRPNEYIAKQDLAAAKPILQRAVRRFCL